MLGHGGSSAGSYLADPTSPIPSHCASIVAPSTLRVTAVMTPHLPVPGNPGLSCLPPAASVIITDLSFAELTLLPSPPESLSDTPVT